MTWVLFDMPSDDFHHKNMENSGLYRRAAEYGDVNAMNSYLASFVIPEIGREVPELRFIGNLSISETIRRMVQLKS